MQIHDPKRLVESLCALPQETGWVEFKENKFNEDSAGQYVSSLANSAMFEGKDVAYLIFGVRDGNHEIVGTSVDLLGERVGTDTFIFWLHKHLEPRLNIKVETVDIDGKHVELLCIDPGYKQPVKFKKIAYIRIGTAQQPIANYPERERALWQITSRYSFETSLLKEHMNAAQIDKAFAYDALLAKIGQSASTRKAKMDYMAASGLIKSDLQGKYEVSTLLAITCARDLRAFASLENKGSRVVV